MSEQSNQPFSSYFTVYGEGVSVAGSKTGCVAVGCAGTGVFDGSGVLLAGGVLLGVCVIKRVGTT